MIVYQYVVCLLYIYIYIYHVNKFEARLLFLYLTLKKNNFSNFTNPVTNVKGILNSIVITTISETEVVAAIKILNSTSAGHDEVPAHILKLNAHLFIKPLTHLVNSSIKNGKKNRQSSTNL